MSKEKGQKSDGNRTQPERCRTQSIWAFQRGERERAGWSESVAMVGFESEKNRPVAYDDVFQQQLQV